MFSDGLLIVGTAAITGLAGTLVVLLWLRWIRRSGDGDPLCGNCKYNLRGSTDNRCPECGKLFIDAGVIARANRSDGTQRSVATILIACSVALLLLVGGGITATLIARQRAARAMAAAVAAQQAALQQSLLKALAPKAHDALKDLLQGIQQDASFRRRQSAASQPNSLDSEAVSQ